MPNAYKGNHQFKPRSTKLPENKPGLILRLFLDSTDSEWYPGNPVGNTEFVSKLGYEAQGSKSSLANAWMEGKPIPIGILVEIESFYPDFPLREYVQAYVEEFSGNRTELIDTLKLALILTEKYLVEAEILMDEFKTEPSERLTSESAGLMLEDPFSAFERDWQASNNRHEGTDPTKEQKRERLARFRRDMARARKKE